MAKDFQTVAQIAEGILTEANLNSLEASPTALSESPTRCDDNNKTPYDRILNNIRPVVLDGVTRQFGSHLFKFRYNLVEPKLRDTIDDWLFGDKFYDENLLLTGEARHQKTFTLYWIALYVTNQFKFGGKVGNFYTQEDIDRHEQELPARVFRYYTAAALGTFAKEALEFDTDSEVIHREYNGLMSAKVVVIDDLNLNTPDWKLPFLSQIIDDLVLKGDKIFLISTNAPISPPEDSKDFNPKRSIEEACQDSNEWARIFGRIMEKCNIIGV